MATVVFFPMIILTAGAILGAVLFTRAFMVRSRRSKDRVQVTAVLVSYTHLRSPAKVVFDYPLPNGMWTRAEKYTARMNYSIEGANARNVFRVEPGFQFPVYVNPQDPMDVELSPASSVSTILLLFGAFACAVFGLGGLMALIAVFFA